MLSIRYQKDALMLKLLFGLAGTVPHFHLASCFFLIIICTKFRYFVPDRPGFSKITICINKNYKKKQTSAIFFKLFLNKIE